MNADRIGQARFPIKVAAKAAAKATGWNGMDSPLDTLRHRT